MTNIGRDLATIVERGDVAVRFSGLGRLSRQAKTSERIAAALVSDIVSNALKPGERLPNEAAMVERFQVGRGSLREALRILEVHGLISLRSGPKGGPVVLAVDPRDVARTFSLYLSIAGATIGELAEARLIVEPIVARLAAQNRDPEALRYLEVALAHETSMPNGDHRYLDAANDFHYVLASMTGNRVFELVATALKELYSTRSPSDGIARQTTEPSIRRQHMAIGEAILKGRQERAATLMQEHMRLFADRITEIAPSFRDSPITWG